MINLTDKQLMMLVGLGTFAVLGAAWYIKSKVVQAGEAIADAAGDAVQAVNPLNSDNIINRGVNNVVQSLTGDESQTLGGWIYDITH